MTNHLTEDDPEGDPFTEWLTDWPIDSDEHWRASLARDGIILAVDDHRPWDWW